MSKTKNYVAVYEHDASENVWLVHIKDVEGCHSYGRSIRQADTRIREALAVWLDKEPANLNITAELPSKVVKLASEVSRLRQEAERVGNKAHFSTLEAARALTDMGLSRRDAADVLGISHQRVQQLLAC